MKTISISDRLFLSLRPNLAPLDRRPLARRCGSTPGREGNRTWGFNSPSGCGRGRRQSTPGVDVRFAFLYTSRLHRSVYRAFGMRNAKPGNGMRSEPFIPGARRPNPCRVGRAAQVLCAGRAQCVRVGRAKERICNQRMEQRRYSRLSLSHMHHHHTRVLALLRDSFSAILECLHPTLKMHKDYHHFVSEMLRGQNSFP